MAINEELRVVITAQNAQLLTAIDDVNKKLGAMGKQSKETASVMASSFDSEVKSAAKWSAAAAAAAAASVYLFKQIADGVETNNNLARSIGFTYQGLERLKFMAGLNGVEQGALTGSLRIMTRMLGDAAIQAGGPTADALKRLGLSIEQVQALSAEEKFALISERLRGVDDAGQRAALGVDIFGNGALQIMPLILSDTEQLKKQFDDIGISLTDIDIAALDAAGDSIDRVSAAATLAAQKFSAEMAPAMQALADITFEVTTGNGQLGESTVGAADIMKIAIGSFLNLMQVLKGVLEVVTAVIMDFGGYGADALGLILMGVNQLWQPFKDLINGLVNVHNLVFKDDPWPLVGDLTLAVDATAKIADNLHNAAVELAKKGAGNIAGGFTGEASKTFNARTAENQQAAADALGKPQGGIETELAEIKSDAELKAAAKQEADAVNAAKALEDEAKRAEEWAEQQRVLAGTELEQLQAKYQALEDLAKEHRDKKLISEETYAETSKAISERLAADEMALAKRKADTDKKAEDAKLKDQQQAFRGTISAAAQHNKTFFELNKVAKLAQAAMNIPSSISGAYDVGAAIGGPITGAAFGAAAGLAQVINMQDVAASSFSGGGGGGSAATSLPTAASAAPQAAAPQAAAPQRIANISLGDSDLFSREQVLALGGKLKEVMGDGFDMRFI